MPDDASGDFAVYYGSSTPQISLQANTGYLWTCSPPGGRTYLGLAMAAGTSPAATDPAAEG